MSYILDALRRADAERQQGQLPGLNSTFEATQAMALPTPRWPRWAALGSLVLVLGAAGLWWWLAGRPASPGATAGAAPIAAVPAPNPAPNPAPVPAQLPAAPEPAPAPPMPSPAMPPLPIVVSDPAPAPIGAPAAVAAPAPAVPPLPAATPSLPAPQAAATRAIPLADLSEAQRRDLPPLQVGGSVWSDSAASRFVILDGQVTREGDLVVPGLTLERINRKSAVLRWREMRIEVGF